MKFLFSALFFMVSTVFAQSTTVACKIAYTDQKTRALVETSKVITTDGNYKNGTVLVQNDNMEVTYNPGGVWTDGATKSEIPSSIFVYFANGDQLLSKGPSNGSSSISLLHGKVGFGIVIDVTCFR